MCSVAIGPAKTVCRQDLRKACFSTKASEPSVISGVVKFYASLHEGSKIAPHPFFEQITPGLDRLWKGVPEASMQYTQRIAGEWPPEAAVFLLERCWYP